MPAVSTRRADADDNEVYSEEELAAEAEAAVDEAAAAAPAVSDSRRRRQMKRGIVTPEPVAAPAPVRKDRPTPSQRTESAAPSSNFVVRFFQNVRTYFREVSVELRKVAWPTREEITRLTYIVLGVTLASAVFLGLISGLFGVMVTQMATQGGQIIAGAIAIALVIIVAGLWLFRERIFKPLE